MEAHMDYSVFAIIESTGHIPVFLKAPSNTGHTTIAAVMSRAGVWPVEWSNPHNAVGLSNLLTIKKVSNMDKHELSIAAPQMAEHGGRRNLDWEDLLDCIKYEIEENAHENTDDGRVL